MMDKKIEQKIKRLHKLAEDLKSGERFEVTKLRTINSLCKDEEVIYAFVIHFLKIKPTEVKGEKEKEKHLKRTTKAINQFVNDRIEKNKRKVTNLFKTMRDVNDQFERGRWGTVRLIKSGVCHFCELALNAVLYPELKSNKCYYLARDLSERYNPSYGTGLIPESYESVKKIAEFWSDSYSKNKAECHYV